jgi:hypothetical protein
MNLGGALVEIAQSVLNRAGSGWPTSWNAQVIIDRYGDEFGLLGHPERLAS